MTRRSPSACVQPRASAARSSGEQTVGPVHITSTSAGSPAPSSARYGDGGEGGRAAGRGRRGEWWGCAWVVGGGRPPLVVGGGGGGRPQSGPDRGARRCPPPPRGGVG